MFAQPRHEQRPARGEAHVATRGLAHPAQDTYHYTNVPIQAQKYDPSLPGARPTDILQMTREAIRVLRGTSKAFAPRDALRMPSLISRP